MYRATARAKEILCGVIKDHAGQVRAVHDSWGGLALMVVRNVSSDGHAGYVPDDARDPAPAGYVYLIGSRGSPMVKIGRTSDIAARLATIQRMSPLRLTVLWTHSGGHMLEAALHRHFAVIRSHGEWFDFGEEDPIRSVREAVEARAGAQATPHQGRSRKSQIIGMANCLACGHAAEAHTGRTGLICDVVYGDSDRDCRCPGFVEARSSDGGR